MELDSTQVPWSFSEMWLYIKKLKYEITGNIYFGLIKDEEGENSMMRSFIIFSFHKILLGWVGYAT
jgi:hypothetical protein